MRLLSLLSLSVLAVSLNGCSSDSSSDPRSDPCSKTIGCKEYGLCEFSANLKGETKCVVSQWGCAQAALCKNEGDCHKKKESDKVFICAPKSKEDCAASKKCEEEGFCSLLEIKNYAQSRVCAVLTDEDCASSKVCQEKGECLAKYSGSRGFTGEAFLRCRSK